MKDKFKKNRKNKDFVEIYGFHAVLAALNNTKRNHKKLIIDSNLVKKIPNLNQKINEVVVLEREKFIKNYGNEKNHQGIILHTSKLIQPNVDDILKKSRNTNLELVVMLDQVTDPQNIGSIIRTCALFRCYSIIVGKNNSPEITSSMAKAASGALEIVNYIKTTNLSRTIKKFKKNNFWIIGFDNNKNFKQQNISLPKKCLLIFGSEDRGMRDLTKKECDQIINIPISTNNKYQIESLNVSTACTIALYEHFKINNL